MANKKAVRLMKVGEFVQNEGAFIRPVTELIQFRIKPNDTYETLYGKIQKEFKKDPEKLAAFASWWEVMEVNDMEIQRVLEYEPETDIVYYVAFDLYDE